MTSPRLSIVIITFHSERFVDLCLTSVARNAGGIDHEVIVVDSASSDGTQAAVRRFPEVRFHDMGANRGVAAARNVALGMARGEYLMILDVDAELTPGALEAMAAFMDNHPGAGMCAPRLHYPDGSLQFSVRRFPTVMTKIARRLPRWLVGTGLDKDEMRDWDHATERRVDYAIGACQFIRSSALAQVGPLDERIFYGPEDVDFCLRLWLAGWQVWYVPSALVIHHEQRTSRGLTNRLFWRHARALAYYFRKHRYLVSTRRLRRRIRRAAGAAT